MEIYKINEIRVNTIKICKLHVIESQERHFGRKKTPAAARKTSSSLHIWKSIHIYIYIYIYTEHIYTYMLHKEKYVNYAENWESRPHVKNTDLTGKYHVKVTFSWKPWNDPMVSTVILPVALRFKHIIKQRFRHRTLEYKLCIKMYISGYSHTPWEYFAPYQTLPTGI